MYGSGFATGPPTAKSMRTSLAAAYGGGSFRRHLDQALDLADDRVAVEVRRDSELSLDLDTPDDLTHPMIAEVLPPWLRTLLASRR